MNYKTIIKRLLNLRYIWTTVNDVPEAELMVRNYIEHRALRNILYGIYPNNSACELGCGYGRMAIILKEYFKNVTGYDREKHFVSKARKLIPSITWTNKIPRSKFNLVMTHTFLQHLPIIEFEEMISNIKDMSTEYVLLTEKTEGVAVTENKTDITEFISIARPVCEYERLMRPFRLLWTKERIVEPTYFNKTAGTIMMFGR